MCRWAMGQKRVFITRVVGSVLLACIPSGAAFAQVTGDLNQIEGVFRFTNQNPNIVSVLNNEGFNYALIYADTVPPAPPLHAEVPITFSTQSGMTASYQITVHGETNLANPGFAYTVRPDTYLDSSYDRYWFVPRISAPVYGAVTGAPPVHLDFEECAGLIHMQFRDENGAPAAVQGNEMSAAYDSDGDGSYDIGSTLAQMRPGSTEERFPVHARPTPADGPLPYHIRVRIQTGSDPYGDTIRVDREYFVEVTCDEIVSIDVVVPTGNPQGGSLGQIIGIVDMLGEHEHPLAPLTNVSAYGPFGNQRFDTILGNPSSGSFVLENLVASDMTSPSTPYSVEAVMWFGLGADFELFRAPFLGLGGPSNPGVLVYPGQTTDVGDTFVMQPGTLVGDILLVGPPPDSTGSCFEAIRRPLDFDVDGDGIPDYLGLHDLSRVDATGVHDPAPGATFSARWGQAFVGFEGAFADASPLESRFEFPGDRDYELRLAGLHASLDEPTLWDPNFFLRFQGGNATGDPNAFRDQRIHALQPEDPRRTIYPGQDTRVDEHYCFGELVVTFRTTGTPFIEPRLSLYGTFPPSVDPTRVDFEGNPARYSVTSSASGTPVNPPAFVGQVVTCLPEGSYQLLPRVWSLNPGGGYTDSGLPAIDVNVACRGVTHCTTRLCIDLDPEASCPAEPTVTVSGAVQSDGNVTRVFYTANGGPEVDCCTNCGVDPQFSCPAQPLSGCDTTFTVTAVDELGDVSTVTPAPVRFDSTAPSLGGCTDQTFVLAGTGTLPAEQVSFPGPATDNCSGTLPVECDNPDPFPVGDTLVTCTSASDSCGHSAACQFTVTVVACGDPAACDDGNACTDDSCDPATGCQHATVSCDDSDPCTADSCFPSTGCVHIPNAACGLNPKTASHWRLLCAGPLPSGEAITEEDVDCVNDTATFADIQTVAELCDRLYPNPVTDKCEQAETRFMALMLNLCHGRVRPDSAIESRCNTANTTVAQAQAQADALLSDPSRSHTACELAYCMSDEINSGRALATNSLRLLKETTGIRLVWAPPYGLDTGPPQSYQIRRRSSAGATFVLAGQTTETNWIDLSADAPYEYEIWYIW